MSDRHHLPADGGPPAWPPESHDPLDDAFRDQQAAAQGGHVLPPIWRHHGGARYLPWERDPRAHENERPPSPHRQIAMPRNLPEDGGPDGAADVDALVRTPPPGAGSQRPTARSEQPYGARYMPWEREPEKLGARDDAEGLRIELEPIQGVTPKAMLPTNLVFQCPPMDEFGVNYAHTHNDYETVRQQLSRKNVPQLATFDFQTLAVDWGCFVVNKETLDPRAYVYYVAWFREKLKEICLSGTPVHLTAYHDGGGVTFDMLGPLSASLGVEIDMDVTLRQVKVTEKSGEGDARYFDLSFVEFRTAEIARRGLGKVKKRKGSLLPTTVTFFPDIGVAYDSSGAMLSADPAIDPAHSHTISLAWLGKHYYKDPSAGRDIARWNHITGYPNGAPLKDYPPYKRLKKAQHAKLKLHTLDEAELSPKVFETVPV